MKILKNYGIEPCGRATAFSLPDITAIDEGTMVGKPKRPYGGHVCDGWNP